MEWIIVAIVVFALISLMMRDLSRMHRRLMGLIKLEKALDAEIARLKALYETRQAAWKAS